MCWNIGANRNLIRKLNSKMGFHQVVPATPKTALKKHTLTVVEMQKIPHIEKTDSREQFFAYGGQYFLVEEDYV